VQIKNRFAATKLRQQRAKYQRIRHVMHVDQIVPPSHVQHGQKKERQKDKANVCPEVIKPACPSMLKRNSINICPVHGLPRPFPALPQTNYIYGITCLNERLSLAPDAWIPGVIRETYHSYSGCHRVASQIHLGLLAEQQ